MEIITSLFSKTREVENFHFQIYSDYSILKTIFSGARREVGFVLVGKFMTFPASVAEYCRKTSNKFISRGCYFCDSLFAAERNPLRF